MLYFAVYSMVHLNGFLNEDVILVDGAMEGHRASPTVSILDLEEEMELGSQLNRGSEENKDSQSSPPSHSPSLAASYDSHTSLDLFGRSVHLNISEKRSPGSGPSRRVLGKLGFVVLARPAPGVSTEVDKPKDEAREKSLAETLESLIGKLPRPDENTITLGPVGFALAQGVYHPASL